MRKMTSHGSADQMLSAFQQRLNILDDKPSDADIESATSIQATREKPSNFHKGSANQMLSAFENKIAELEGDVDAATDITASAVRKKNNYVEVESNPEAVDTFIHSLIDDVNSELEDLDIFDGWTWESSESEVVLTTVKDSDVQEYSIPFDDLSFDSSSIEEDVQYILKAVTDEDADEVTSSSKIAASDKSAAIPSSAKSEYYQDVDGVLGDADATYSLEDLMIIWNSEHTSDPTMSQYESFDDWWQDTKQWMKPSSEPTEEVDDEMFTDDDGIFGNPGDIISKRDMRTYYEENHDSDPSLMDYNSFEDWWSATQSMLTPVTNSTDVEASYDEVESDVYEELESKQVQDSDGFYTDYTLYKNMITGEYVCVFGDKDVYRPEDSDHDYECENESEAYEWFESYNGFEEEDDVYSATALYQNPYDEDDEDIQGDTVAGNGEQVFQLMEYSSNPEAGIEGDDFYCYGEFFATDEDDALKQLEEAKSAYPKFADLADQAHLFVQPYNEHFSTGGEIYQNVSVIAQHLNQDFHDEEIPFA